MIGFPPFRPRLPWLGPDLQTLRNFLVRPRIDLSRWPARSMEFAMRDGSGDRLVGMLHAGAGPLAVLVHGLTGTAESTYVLATARHLLGLGYAVLRLNLRGAGASQKLCRERYHAGRSQDLRDVIAGLPAALVGDGVVAVGYSLGANMLLKLLGEEGRAPGLQRLSIRAAAAVSAPIALASSSRQLMTARNILYHRHLLSQMKEEALHPAAGLNARERAAVTAARSIYEFDELVVGPRNGFSGADEYYARCSSDQFLGDIAASTLVVHALDDPWIPAAEYVAMAQARPSAVSPLLPAGGGHVGFHGVGSSVPWHDRCIAQFFAAALSADVRYLK